jgi:hypothetical protein
MLRVLRQFPGGGAEGGSCAGVSPVLPVARAPSVRATGGSAAIGCPRHLGGGCVSGVHRGPSNECLRFARERAVRMRSRGRFRDQVDASANGRRRAGMVIWRAAGCRPAVALRAGLCVRHRAASQRTCPRHALRYRGRPRRALAALRWQRFPGRPADAAAPGALCAGPLLRAARPADDTAQVGPAHPAGGKNRWRRRHQPSAPVGRDVCRLVFCYGSRIPASHPATTSLRPLARIVLLLPWLPTALSKAERP